MEKNTMNKEEGKKNELTKAEENQAVAKVSELGDGTVFVKKTEDGFVKAVNGLVTLSKDKGHIYELNGKHSITKAGYDHMNKIAGVSIITPNTLQLPSGQVVVNPYPILDKATGSIKKVWVKKTAIGLSPTGNLTMTSRTLLYDIDMYFIQDLAKKIKFNKQAGRYCHKSSLKPADLENGIFMEITQGMGVWANTQNAEVLKAIDTYIQNKLFAERKAQTICERNAMKSHPALSQGTTIDVEKDGKTALRVIGWVNDFTESELEELKKRAEIHQRLQKSADDMDSTGIEIDDQYHDIDEEDLREPIDEPEADLAPDDDDIPEAAFEEAGALEVPQVSTDNLDIKYQEFVEAYGAVAVEKVIKTNFAGKKWKDLDAIEKATAINRLNSSSLNK